jgi:uncharacterized protein (DUF305 family)
VAPALNRPGRGNRTFPRPSRAGRPVAVAVLVTGLLGGAVAGCGAGDVAGAAPAPAPGVVGAPGTPAGSAEPGDRGEGRRNGPFNAADVMFLQMMIEHNGQGVELARLGADRAAGEEVRTLAAAVEATQTGENGQMYRWLRTWRQPLRAAPEEHAAHGGMPGLGQGALLALRRSGPAEFDRRFLNLLIAHQDDAVQLARQVVATGRAERVRALAERIDVARSAQITYMLGLLGQERGRLTAQDAPQGTVQSVGQAADQGPTGTS